MPTINQLRAVTPFRAEYCYNNWGFEVAGRLIKKLSGMTFSKYLSDRIFQPLGMTRTFNDDSECHGAENVAMGYMTLDDASPYPVTRPHMAEGTLMNPTGGIQSTINDLLKCYRALMKAAQHQFETGETSSPGSRLKQLTHVLSSNIKTAPRLREQSYAMGWARVQLPGTLCDTSQNQPAMAQMPIVGDPSNPCLALYHHGMLVGFNNAVYLFPETQTAIVLLSNAVAINDGPSWIGHLIMLTLFNDSIKRDYVALAREKLAFGVSTPMTALRRSSRLKLANHTIRLPHRLDDYLGKYYNQVKTFFISITKKGDEL